ncbi:hypothetical protein [Mycolicibacterium senegalense]|uniref:hypothetical protein n=1 Tax=Mycolicibacterium senegalense TaxID=1796 RepID=UPI000457A70B|nr:hypothetical protein [Mycolicibacterium senegalense]MCV7338619.1 hypothetical protein [Mycolicibacterium senegalense]MDR7289678.1 hypothetical protein [Mycolicibacterium senegalense]QZA26493.1 hypothetical protein K3U95_10840 [Mycolicibacterium senegalense]CDP82943.1 phage integrase [Mycolicibacterium farcinogenes]
MHRSGLTRGPAAPHLLVHGKGGKLRVVPINDDLASAIGEAEALLFSGDDDGYLPRRYVGKLLANALPDHWTAHTCATVRHQGLSRIPQPARGSNSARTVVSRDHRAVHRRG